MRLTSLKKNDKCYYIELKVFVQCIGKYQNILKAGYSLIGSQLALFTTWFNKNRLSSTTK